MKAEHIVLAATAGVIFLILAMAIMTWNHPIRYNTHTVMTSDSVLCCCNCNGPIMPGQPFVKIDTLFHHIHCPLTTN